MVKLTRFNVGWAVLAALVVGCGKAPETPPEQRTTQTGQEAMDKVKAMSPTPTGKDARGQHITDKAKSAAKTGK